MYIYNKYILHLNYGYANKPQMSQDILTFIYILMQVFTQKRLTSILILNYSHDLNHSIAYNHLNCPLYCEPRLPYNQEYSWCSLWSCQQGTLILRKSINCHFTREISSCFRDVWFTNTRATKFINQFCPGGIWLHLSSCMPSLIWVDKIERSLKTEWCPGVMFPLWARGPQC